MKRFLTKSKYLAALQCPWLLWYYYNSPDDIPEVVEVTQAIFDTGHVVGDLANRLCSDGVEISFTEGLKSTMSATAELLPRRIPPFEAGFLVDVPTVGSTSSCRRATTCGISSRTRVLRTLKTRTWTMSRSKQTA